jgi:hypothetical protein
MAVRPELRLKLPNSPGALARITRVLADDQVRILAFSLESNGLLRLVTNNPPRAVAALAREHVAVEQHDVVVTTVAVRSVSSVLASAASAGVNLEYAYASTVDQDAMVLLVLGVDDAQRAAAAAGL